MKKLLFTFCFLAIHFVYGQDTLIYRNGTKELVRVVKTEAEFVNYLPWPLTNDANVVSKSSRLIGTVKTEDGKVVNLVYYEPLAVPEIPDYNKNFVAIDMFDLFFSQLTISYQHTFKKPAITLRVPLSTSFLAFGRDYKVTDYRNYYSPNKYFSSGLDVMFFFDGKVNDGFLGGVSYDVGKYKYFDYMGMGDPYGNTTDFSSLPNVTYNGFFVRGGYMINRLDKVAFGVYVDAGTCSRTYRTQIWDQNYNTVSYIYYKDYSFDMRLKLSIGYSF